MQDLVGHTFGHYRILDQIGAGGMGVVYRARDERLDRDVAIKVLPDEFAQDPGRLARFEREAKALAALNHPNIATVYGLECFDGGEAGDGAVHMLVMELLEGDSLRARVPPGGMGWQRSVEIGAAVAEGLAAAHGKGIIHRDLKPENIFLTTGGQVRILDFGLSRQVEPVDADSETATMRPDATAAGTVLGTMGYMSPEQLRGEVVDSRSDIFSLGCVLYEMLTGRQAFRKRTSADTSAAILREEPAPPAASGVELPADLERDIRRCLEKSPDARFQSAADLAFALRSLLAGHGPPTLAPGPSVTRRAKRRSLWWGLAAAIIVTAVAAVWLLRSTTGDGHVEDAPRRIVVLPFENLGPPDDAYFADGMTEEITARLAAARGLTVISRTSARQYARTAKSIPEIGEELGVGYVLEGTVRWARGENGASRIRVTPLLIRVADDAQVWAESYDRVMDDVFDVQLEIAQSVTDHLGVVLTGSDRRLIESRPTENLDAYQAFLRGRHWATRPHFTVENWERRMRAFEQAVQLDPGFALAHAELARGHAVAYYLREDLSPGRLAAADASAARALDLAPDDPRVLLNLGFYRLWGYRDVESSLAYFVSAGRGRPDNADVLDAKASVYGLQGRWEEALDVVRRAVDLSPRSADLMSELGRVLIVLRRYPQALAATDQAINLAPDAMWPYLYKILTLWSWRGDPGVSRPVLEGVPITDDAWVTWYWYWQEMYERRYGDALGHLESTTDGWLRIKILARPNPLLAAYVHERLGDTERAASGYESARRLLEAEVAASPEDPRLHSSLGIVYAVQGRREDAIREGRKACELLPRSKDGFYYLPFVIDLAHIHVILGDHDAALEQIEYLLDNPSWISAPFLRMDPRWDPLRSDPRFQALLEEHEVES